MSDPTPDRDQGKAAHVEAARRRRLAEVFGDVLPDQTRDEVAEAGERRGSAERDDDWLRAQVPPHHGR